jgi:lipoprotein-anchoring transpeptidase ErfK/SrfK
MRISMTGRHLIRSSIALFLLGFFSGCADLETAQKTANDALKALVPPHLENGFFNDEGASGPAKIVVSVSKQRAFFFRGKTVVGESTVSTGKPGFSTPPGHYKVVWKDKEHISTVFGDYVDDFGNVAKSNIDSRKDHRPSGSHFDGARMPYAMFFRGGYAMHQGYVPPYAASHGCIRLPHGMAERFFDATPLGTPVIVKE